MRFLRPSYRGVDRRVQQIRAGQLGIGEGGVQPLTLLGAGKHGRDGEYTKYPMDQPQLF